MSIAFSSSHYTSCIVSNADLLRHFSVSVSKVLIPVVIPRKAPTTYSLCLHYMRMVKRCSQVAMQSSPRTRKTCDARAQSLPPLKIVIWPPSPKGPSSRASLGSDEYNQDSAVLTRRYLLHNSLLLSNSCPCCSNTGHHHSPLSYVVEAPKRMLYVNPDIYRPTLPALTRVYCGIRLSSAITNIWMTNFEVVRCRRSPLCLVEYNLL